MQKNYGNVFLFVTGQMVSVLGSSIYLVAVILFLKELTGQPSALGIFQFVAYLPIVLLAPGGGMLADAFNSKKIMVLTDLIRGLIMVGLGLLLHSGSLTYSLLLAGTFLVSCCTALFLPAVHSLFPEIIAPPFIRKANSVKSASLFAVNLAGTSLGGLAYAVLGPAWVFITNGFSFCASALEESFIRYTPRARPEKKVFPGDTGKRIREAVNYFRKEKGISTVLLTYALINSLYPPVILSLPFLLEQEYGAGNSAFGLSLALLLGGGGLGSLLYGFSPSREKLNQSLFFGSLSVLAILLGSVFVIPGTPVLMTVLPAAGFAIGMVHQIITTSLYRLVEPESRGRVFGVMESLASFAVPVSYALSGFAIQMMQNRLPLFYLLMGVLLGLAAAGIRFLTPLGMFLSSDAPEKPDFMNESLQKDPPERPFIR